MAEKFWINAHTRVWLINPPNEPLFLLHVGVELIEWPDRAIIHGPLPSAAILSELQNGAIFEILLYLRGVRPDIYENGKAILRLSNTRIKKRIEHPVVNYPGLDNKIELKLILDCDIELFADASPYIE
jgi:hypothetical protein